MTFSKVGMEEWNTGLLFVIHANAKETINAVKSWVKMHENMVHSKVKLDYCHTTTFGFSVSNRIHGSYADSQGKYCTEAESLENTIHAALKMGCVVSCKWRESRIIRDINRFENIVVGVNKPTILPTDKRTKPPPKKRTRQCKMTRLNGYPTLEPTIDMMTHNMAYGFVIYANHFTTFDAIRSYIIMNYGLENAGVSLRQTMMKLAVEGLELQNYGLWGNERVVQTAKFAHSLGCAVRFNPYMEEYQVIYDSKGMRWWAPHYTRPIKPTDTEDV